MNALTTFRALSISLVVLFLPVAAASGVVEPAPVEPALLKVFIGFDHQPGPADAAMITDLGGTVKYQYHLIPAIAATVNENLLEDILAQPGVTSIEPDGEMFAFDEYNRSWGIERIGTRFSHAGGFAGQSVKVAVLDTGVDYTHPELSPVYVGGYDFINNDDDPMDDHFHGTHVAGTIAAALDGVGVVGVTPQIELYAFKVLGSNGSGNFSDLVAAIEVCADLGIQVTNQSLGSPTSPGSFVELAYDNAYESGVLHVAAAGNLYGLLGIGYPARYDSVIAVGATNERNGRPLFSDNGPQLELAAPGVNIVSTNLGGGYRTLDGTSMASPHAAGVAAAVFASDVTDENGNGRINDDVRVRLALTAIDLGAPGRDNNYGFGLVNVMAAVAEPMGIGTTGLVAGQDATIGSDGCTAGATVYFYYGLNGTGPTPINEGGFLLAIKNPAIAGSATANNNGRAAITVRVPGNASGVNVWLQSAENGNTSTVLSERVQ